MQDKKNILFYFLWVITLAFFLWTRLDFSDRIYYFGDGTAVVALIDLMLDSGNWDPNWYRLVSVVHIEEDVKELMNLPQTSGYFYHTAGYIMIAAVICKAVYAAGFSELPIQTILHAINVVVQALTLWLVYRIGNRIANRYVGLLSVVFFTLFPLAIMEAHYERIESWLCLLATAVVYVSLHFRQSPKSTGFLIGVLIGLGIAAKFSQLYLGLIPFILLVNFLIDKEIGSVPQRIFYAISYGLLVLSGLVLAIGINVPYIFEHFAGYLESIKSIQGFYTIPAYPYAEESYSYVGQLYVISRYFVMTLGMGWVLCYVAGIAGFFHKDMASQQNPLIANIFLVAPVLILVFYFALQVNFIERNFSPVEGLISVSAGLGFYGVWKTIAQKSFPAYLKWPMCTGLLAVVFYQPIKLDTVFVKNHIKTTSHAAQVAFQNRMKNDFPGFWIKNLSFTHNVTLKLPEKPEKAPRIYQIEDLNEHRARQFIEVLKANDYVHVAQFCSDFVDMPPNTLTIYHAPARNNYFVRRDEWPTNLPADYFKTNCAVDR